MFTFFYKTSDSKTYLIDCKKTIICYHGSKDYNKSTLAIPCYSVFISSLNQVIWTVVYDWATGDYHSVDKKQRRRSVSLIPIAVDIIALLSDSKDAQLRRAYSTFSLGPFTEKRSVLVMTIPNYTKGNWELIVYWTTMYVQHIKTK